MQTQRPPTIPTTSRMRFPFRRPSQHSSADLTRIALHKRSIATAAALLAVGLIVGIGPAQAKTRTKTIDVHSHYTEPAGSVDGAQCRGLATFTPDCGIRETGYSTFTGTMWGDEHYDLTGADPSALPDGKITYEGAAYITGGVEGCGTGTYILDNTDGYIDMTKYDPITDSAPGYNKWHLRPGSGTGELTNLVSGEGVNNWTIHLAGTVGVTPMEGEGDFTGTITCHR